MEVVQPRDGDAVTLGTCPPWCTTPARHFNDGDVIHADDGYHYYGPEAAIVTSDRMLLDSLPTVVRAVVKSWTCPLGADPGPVLVELNLGTAEAATDMCAEITPGQARAVATALLDAAAIAERGGQD